MRSGVLTLAVVLALAATARGQDRQPPGGDKYWFEIGPDHEGPTFGQEPGEERTRIRFHAEGTWAGAFFDSRFKWGQSGHVNSWDPQRDAKVPRFATGAFGWVGFKMFDFYGMGLRWLSLSSDGADRAVKRDIRVGNPASEYTLGARADSRVAFDQISFTLDLFVLDDPVYRLDAYMGLTWASYRVRIHPDLPLQSPVLQPGSLSLTQGRATEAWFTPMLGIFFAWNVHPRFAVFVDAMINYFSWSEVGSTAGHTRAGVRVKLWRGLELVVGGFYLSGQVFDLRDAWGDRGPGHQYRQSRWSAVGPEVGLSFIW